MIIHFKLIILLVGIYLYLDTSGEVHGLLYSLYVCVCSAKEIRTQYFSRLYKNTHKVVFVKSKLIRILKTTTDWQSYLSSVSDFSEPATVLQPCTVNS